MEQHASGRFYRHYGKRMDEKSKQAMNMTWLGREQESQKWVGKFLPSSPFARRCPSEALPNDMRQFPNCRQSRHI
jgi:hypothetical protein